MRNSDIPAHEIFLRLDLNKAFKTEVKFSSINGVKDLEDLFNYFT